jgi:hypothetical protein
MKASNFVERAQQLAALEEECLSYVETIVDKYKKEFEMPYIKQVIKFEACIQSKTVCITYYYCGSDQYIDIPLEYFTDFDGAVARQRALEETQRKLYEERELKQQAEQAAAFEAMERANFERLKEKYGT